MNKRLRKGYAGLLAVAAATALALSGCANGQAGAASEEGGRIRVAFMQPPKAAMHPYSDDAFKYSRLSAAETLVRLDEDAGPEPLLATGWEKVDDLTWVFTLRDDVTFQDGAHFDAEAVKTTIDHASASATPPRALKGVKLTTEATGEYEVTITTDIADAMLPNRLASPQFSIFSPAAYGAADGSVNTIGTGTGPFELTEINGSSTLTLERYDDYWGDVAIAEGIDASFVPDGTARAAAIRAGEADVAETIPVSQVSLLDPETVNEVYMPRTTHIALNTESGPFADPAVRAAARAAIDQDAIAATIYEGYADPAIGLLGPALPWAADLRGDVDSSTPPATVDGVEITLATYTDRAENPEIAVQAQAQLEDAGFVVKQDVREYANMEEEMLNGGFDAVILSRNTMIDTGDPLSALMQDFSCDGGNNVSQLCLPELDTIFTDGLKHEPGAERQKATMAAEAMVLQNSATIPITHERVIQGELGTWVGFERDPFERRLVTEHTKPAV
ncbi:MAG: ABC transporter substrate-binding protein [Leucobacter sp.]